MKHLGAHLRHQYEAHVALQVLQLLPILLPLLLRHALDDLQERRSVEGDPSTEKDNSSQGRAALAPCSSSSRSSGSGPWLMSSRRLSSCYASCSPSPPTPSTQASTFLSAKPLNEVCALPVFARLREILRLHEPISSRSMRGTKRRHTDIQPGTFVSPSWQLASSASLVYERTKACVYRHSG